MKEVVDNDMLDLESCQLVVADISLQRSKCIDELVISG